MKALILWNAINCYVEGTFSRSTFAKFLGLKTRIARTPQTLMRKPHIVNDTFIHKISRKGHIDSPVKNST
jgi:hypothetical protein